MNGYDSRDTCLATDLGAVEVLLFKMHGENVSLQVEKVYIAAMRALRSLLLLVLLVAELQP